MADFVLLCKSYRRDATRVKRLLDSLQAHNPESIPVVLCVPQGDLSLFREVIGRRLVELVTDEDVVRSHPLAASKDLLARYQATPGYRAQQVVKSDAWRLLRCDSLLCMDADTVFLRDIRRADFLTPAGHPYTVMHQGRELLQLAIDRGQTEVLRHFMAESASLKAIFGRSGPDYDFGPTPLPWSAQVWSDLHERLLEPRSWTLWDAIDHAPSEIRWYGEALLAFRSIPLDPIEPLFRVYHHDWHYELLRRLGENETTVAQLYLGAVYQSNWQVDLDPPSERSRLSRLARRLRRLRHRFFI